MRYIRENIFLLSAAGAVILIGAIMLASSASIGGDVDKALSNRKKLSKLLVRLGKLPVNAEIVKKEQQRVEAAQATLRAAIDRSIAWNRRNYQPFTLPFNAEDGKRLVSAFPADQQLYGHYDLTFKAALVYREQELPKLLASLRPVVPPTQEQIKKEQAVWEKRLHDEWLRRKAKTRKAAEAAKGGIAEGDRETPEEGAPTAQQILTAATEALLVKHAQTGLIYTSREALDIVLPGPEKFAPPISQIWLAQLNYWITKDIIAAISATNEISAGLAKSRNETHSVLNAAVKELVKIEIDEKYVGGGKVPGRPTRRPTPGTPRPAAATPGVTGVVNSFTQRGSCQQYDVLRYKFTIVMPTRFLNALEQNLMNRNYHTILGVQITELSDIPANRYYGTDPVMTVALQGELLLLTAWVRGREHDCKISERDAIVDGKNRWWDFLNKLSRQGRQDKPSPGKHIWSLLSSSLKQNITRSIATRRVDSATKEKVIREFNDLLAGKEFYDKASWQKQNAKLGLWEKALLVKLNKKTIQSADVMRLNRSLLKAAFPNEIAESPYLPPMMPGGVEPTKPPRT